MKEFLINYSITFLKQKQRSRVAILFVSKGNDYIPGNGCGNCTNLLSPFKNNFIGKHFGGMVMDWLEHWNFNQKIKRLVGQGWSLVCAVSFPEKRTITQAHPSSQHTHMPSKECSIAAKPKKRLVIYNHLLDYLPIQG